MYITFIVIVVIVVVIVLVLVVTVYRLSPSAEAWSVAARTYPHPRIPAARLFYVFQCFPMLSSTWGNPEVGGGDNFWGSYPTQVPSLVCGGANWA